MKTKNNKNQKQPQGNEESDGDSSEYSGLEDDENESTLSSEEDISDTDDDSDRKEGNDSYNVTNGSGLKEKKTVSSVDDSDISDEDFFGDQDSKSEKYDENCNVEDHKTETLKIDEYAEDTSDEEDIRNTVGNIPMQWYDDFPHIGYDVEGKKIMKPATNDEIDEFLSKIDDPNYWRTVRNKMTGEKVFLTDEHLELIQRIQAGKYPTAEDQYQPFEDFFTYETMKHPVTNIPPHKRSFIPSKIEKEKVSKLVYAIKMGWIKPRVPKEEKDPFYMLWDKDSVNESKRMQHYIPAPKRKLPGHEESYNPPPEYLFTKEEEEKWKETDPEDRKLDFIPQRYSSLRQVPAYSRYINEWFERCLDLYLCPRQRKMRVNVDPNDLIPQLPKPKDLQPFPSVLAIVFKGHSGLVRCVTVESTGQFIASGSDDNTIKVWEVLTGRCLSTINVGGPVKSLDWCPNPALSLILVAVNEKLYIVNPKVGDKVIISNTDALLTTAPENPEVKDALWSLPTEEQKASGIRLIITHTKEIKKTMWHAKGDYFAALTTDIGCKSIIIHQLSKFRSQMPFEKSKGSVQCILFHPLRPFFFIATQKHIRVYNLLKQEMSKLLQSNCKWISSIAVHPQGDNIIIGSYDSKVSWFDLELSSKPYKMLRHHAKAVRQVAFHKRYPLFASTSDDGSLIVCHGMVYSDLLQNPTIVPVKILKGQGISLDCCFHPQRPWVFSTSDDTIRLYS
ncbi:ribosome biogenesis protein bop1-like [Stegodyphus dumicola]|uniref:ribosome biogenesis protein bop1-like n=1 Tax=Stegodyphus dumicola TaxID=202533 RepID=UPI0015B1B155|nr:ribosome biogenesis protein bop1-like [Stegodyphus dumicola]